MSRVADNISIDPQKKNSRVLPVSRAACRWVTKEKNNKKRRYKKVLTFAGHGRKKKKSFEGVNSQKRVVIDTLELEREIAMQKLAGGL